MASFSAFEPEVEVNGTTVQAVAAGMGVEALPILAAHGLDQVAPDEWYSQQAWLNVFHDIANAPSNAMFDLVAIGMAIPDNAVFPPDIDSMTAALQSIDVAYHMNHRGGDIGRYEATVHHDDHVTLVCENPYPCDFDYGIIYGMARRFQPKGKSFYVYHDENAPCRKNGADSCTYHVVTK